MQISLGGALARRWHRGTPHGTRRQQDHNSGNASRKHKAKPEAVGYEMESRLFETLLVNPPAPVILPGIFEPVLLFGDGMDGRDRSFEFSPVSVPEYLKNFRAQIGIFG